MRWNERVERVPKKKNWYICTHGVIKNRVENVLQNYYSTFK